MIRAWEEYARAMRYYPKQRIQRSRKATLRTTPMLKSNDRLQCFTNNSNEGYFTNYSTIQKPVGFR